MNFILVLPLKRPELYNALLNVSCKFLKAKIFILERNNDNTADWAIWLLAHLSFCNWGIPQATLSDRDFKFRFELWEKLFQTLGTKLLISTTYHPQTNGFLKKTNQTIEIVLYFLFTSGAV